MQRLYPRPISNSRLHDLSERRGTIHSHQYSVFGLSRATSLESSHALVTKSHVDCLICLRQLVCCFLLCVFPIFALPGLDLKVGVLTDEHFISSVTVISIVRLVYIVRVRTFFAFFADSAIWTNVAVAISIVCGQCVLEFRTLPRSHSRDEVAEWKVIAGASPPSGPYYHSSPKSSNYYASARVTRKEAPNYSWICYRQANQHHHQFYRYREDRAGMRGRIPRWIRQSLIHGLQS